MPSEVRVATEAYQREEDVLGHFLAECVVFGPQYTVTKTDIYLRYTTWATQEGERVESKKAFGQALKERDGITEDRNTGARWWVGLRLRDPAEAAP
jgi:putative DNA primase/helicase